MVHTISLALWGEVAPVRVSERGNSLAGLYGLSDLVRVSCTVVVGVGALVGGQSRIESEFPPSVRHSPASFPQGGRLFRGSCFAVAGIGGEVGGQSRIESESPLSVPLGHLSPKGETIFYIYALLVFVICKGDGFFGGSCFAVAGVVWVVFASLYLCSYKKSHLYKRWDF